MFKALIPPLRYYVTVILIMTVLKPLFVLINSGSYTGTGFSDILNVMRAGFAMDASMAAYLAMVTVLIAIAAQWIRRPGIINGALRCWYWFTAVAIAVCFILDAMLYGYWGFKLDTTPIFYFTSSPQLAFASVSVWESVAGFTGTAALSYLLYRLIRFGAGTPAAPQAATRPRLASSGLLLLLAGVLFIPLRGGFTVSTMNLSSAYFSNDTRLNHAAVNPMFSLFYSATHGNDYSTAFAFFDDKDAEARFNRLNLAQRSDSTAGELLKVKRPDIYIVILESFSNFLMPSLGGEEIAVGLDSIGRSGLMFDRFYASSFRTDRALPAILSGYPGQPTTSVMKDVARAESLPSIASSLINAGYTADYYYGGDINFTNMLAYLKSSGFGHIICDRDFPLSQRLSKWGVPDGPLFERAISELKPYNPEAPRFTVIQTSSSHEPFDVDRTPRTPDEPKQVTAFAYADSCATAFVNALRDSGSWDSSIVILVPDHYGCYPKGITDEDLRHSVPLVITGGALASRGTVSRIGNQTDIAATLLSAMGLPHQEFRFSNDLLDPTRRGYSFFSSPGCASMVTPEGMVTLNTDSGTAAAARGDSTGIADSIKAYLQTIYRDLAGR